MTVQAARPRDEDSLVPAMVFQAAELEPQAIAIHDEDRAWSFSDLVQRADLIAAGIRAEGLTHEEVIALVQPRGAERIAATLGIWSAGGAPLLLDPSWPHARLTELIERAGCRLVIGGTAAQAFANTTSLTLDHADVASVARTHDDMAIAADDLAYVIATSGSSGTPKLVEITHGNLAALVHWHNDAFSVTAADRATHLAGLGFDAAVWEVWPYLAVGASLAIAPERVRSDAVMLRDWLITTGATVAFVPTLMAEQLVRLAWPETRLRTVLTGGDRLRAAPPSGLPFTLVNNYGPTECTVVASSGVVPPAGDCEPPSIGAPITGTVIQILDQDRLPVTPGAIGEIWIGGRSVGRGYRGDAEATAAAFGLEAVDIGTDTRFYRSGDLGSWKPDGTIAFHGRADDQLKIRGHRVEPDEVGAVLSRHPHVVAAAVTAAGEGERRVLVAYVQPSSGPVPGSEDLRAFLAERLPDWAVPAHYIRVERLPVTASGKLDRAALPPPTEASHLPRQAFVPPTTPAEAQLLAIMAEIMGGREIGVEDNFFLLGGHSLLGTQVVLRAGERFGVELTLRHLFQAPTVRRLAAVIETLVEELVAGLSEEEVLLHAHG